MFSQAGEPISPKWQGSRGTSPHMALFQENPGWWNIIIYLDDMMEKDGICMYVVIKSNTNMGWNNPYKMALKM